MGRKLHIESRNKTSLRWKAIGVLLVTVCLLFTVLLWWMLVTLNANIAQSRLDAQVDTTVDMLEKRVEAYTDSLYGLRALFLVHPDTTKDEWDGFVLTQSFTERYPGLDNLAYVDRTGEGKGTVVYVSNDEMEAFVGTDAAGSDIHQEALVRAEQTSTPAATLVHGPAQNMPDIHQHFFIALTTYRTIPSPGASVEARAALATGYVVALVDSDQLLGDSLEGMAARQDVHVIVSGADGNVFYESGPEETGMRVTKAVEMNVGGQPWYLSFSAPIDYQLTDRERIAPLFFFVGGLLFTVLLVSLYFSRAGVRIRLTKR